MIPGCRAYRRKRSESTDYDLVGSFEGPSLDFRSELGRYFVCECKDWKKPADFTTVAKLARVLDSVKSRFGILMSKKGISGAGDLRFAEREQLKVYADRGVAIVVITECDLERIAKGESFLGMLRNRYETIRLDLPSDTEGMKCSSAGGAQPDPKPAKKPPKAQAKAKSKGTPKSL